MPVTVVCCVPVICAQVPWTIRDCLRVDVLPQEMLNLYYPSAWVTQVCMYRRRLFPKCAVIKPQTFSFLSTANMAGKALPPPKHLTAPQ